jgi:hypothetical protein
MVPAMHMPVGLVGDRAASSALSTFRSNAGNPDGIPERSPMQFDLTSAAAQGPGVAGRHLASRQALGGARASASLELAGSVAALAEDDVQGRGAGSTTWSP